RFLRSLMATTKVTIAMDRMKDQIDKLEAQVRRLFEAHGRSTEFKRRKKDDGVPDDVFNADCAVSSSSQAPTEGEKMKRRIAEVYEDLRCADPDLDLIQNKMERLDGMYHEYLVEEMRERLNKTIGTSVEKAEKITVASAIARMDAAMNLEFPLAEWRKKPEQPKGCSRALWMDHIKMSKKFAELFAHISVIQRSGKLENINMEMATDVMYVAERYAEQNTLKDLRAKNKHVNKLVAYEVLKRLEEHEYFFCPFCNEPAYNVKQYLAHFGSGAHGRSLRKLEESRELLHVLALASSLMLKLSTISDEIHTFFSKQFTGPILENGGGMPGTDKHTMPTLAFLADVERKYAKAINGDVDEERLDDAAYVASILPGIIERHKSPIGKQLFAEFHEYLGKGRNLYCHRCRWTVSNRTLFYRHHASPFHVTLCHSADDYLGKQFNLMTVSINVHLKNEL
ncbi:hypothetical protein PRIPAC_83612, partial [Pristionchus pacificus]